MLRKIPRRLLQLWQADYELDPWDRIGAQIVASLQRLGGVEHAHPIDFIPILKDAPRGEDDGALMRMQLHNRTFAQEEI